MCVRACVDAGFAMRSWDVLSFIAFAIVTLIVYHDRFPPPLFARVSLVNGTGRTGADTGPRLEVPTALRSSSSGLAASVFHSFSKAWPTPGSNSVPSRETLISRS